MNNKSHHGWVNYTDDTFAQFAQELEEFGEKGVLPPHADQDLRYSMELMKHRLEKNHLSCEYHFRPRGHFVDRGLGKSWKDEHYATDMEMRTCEYTRVLRREGKKLFRRKERSDFRQYITSTVKEEKVGDDPYTCPNCGAVSKIKVLKEGGCPYCGTRFKMSDLYPKVSGYSMEYDIGRTRQEALPQLFLVMAVFMLAITAALLYNAYTNEAFAHTTTGYKIFYAAAVGIFGGAFLGYISWAIFMLGKIISHSGSNYVVSSNYRGAKDRFENEVKKYTLEFSYEYFSNKAISMLRTLLFAENMEQVPNYVGESVQGRFGDIVGCESTGPVGVCGLQIKDGYCNVTIQTYMDTLRYNGGKLRARRELYRMYLYKNLNIPINMFFSIRKIQCKSCGASFDATRRRTCPSCDSRYVIGDDDWVILKVEKV